MGFMLDQLVEFYCFFLLFLFCSHTWALLFTHHFLCLTSSLILPKLLRSYFLFSVFVLLHRFLDQMPCSKFCVDNDTFSSRYLAFFFFFSSEFSKLVLWSSRFIFCQVLCHAQPSFLIPHNTERSNFYLEQHAFFRCHQIKLPQPPLSHIHFNDPSPFMS